MKICFSLFLTLFSSTAALADTFKDLRSDGRGLSTAERNEQRVALLTPKTELRGYTELLPYVLASPDQEEAGSCLYMSLTGIAEWWLARLNPEVSRAVEGPIDLSERYLMNFAGIEENETELANWRTDAIYLFNRLGGKSVLNSRYRFTKGWFFGTPSDNDMHPAPRGAKGAKYNAEYNWFDEARTVSDHFVALPTFARSVIFEDPERDQWNVGVAPSDIVERVKTALVENKAPVHVVYNHNGYWHAVYIVGFDDQADHQNCAYTETFRRRIQERADEFAKLAREATTDGEREYYERRATKALATKQKLEDAYEDRGGCHGSQGVFYIRDSIYPNEKGPLYDYDLANEGEASPYTKKIVLKEYDWLLYFANNVSQIFPEVH